jgi:hypothetical protein
MPFVNAIAVNSPGEPAGQINPNEVATVTFQVQIVNPLPPGVTQVVNQGLVQGSGIPGANTDDPRTPEVNDPTVTPLTPLTPPPTEPNLRLLPSRQKNTYFRSGSKAIAKTGSAKKLEYKYLAVLGHSEKIKIKAD